MTELLAFRRGYYDLFVALLAAEPAGLVLDALADRIEDRIDGGRRLHADLGQGWAEIAQALADLPRDGRAGAVAEEYTRLFVGPGVPEVNLYESYYLTGRLFDRPLALLRSTLSAAGITKDPSCAEPEDWLALELDTMRRLLEREAVAPDDAEAERWRQAQADFLGRHLLVWAPAAARDLARASGARLYRGVARVLSGFLALERDLLDEWGAPAPLSLEAAQSRFRGTGEWRGPLVDFGGAREPDRAEDGGLIPPTAGAP